jgi:Family of unknown function (DUF6428)
MWSARGNDTITTTLENFPMTITELRRGLASNPNVGLHLMLPDGDFVPAHFHITEVGRVQKDFVDCGGTARSSTTCVLQAWVAADLEHRITSSKLLGILEAGASLLTNGDWPVEFEYEGERISQYPIAAAEVTPGGILFHLGTKHTACLAPDLCGVPAAGSCGTAGCC